MSASRNKLTVRTQTNTGLPRIDFRDIDQQRCLLREVVAQGERGPLVFFGLCGRGGQMVLDQDDVAALLPYLQRFVDEGRLL